MTAVAEDSKAGAEKGQERDAVRVLLDNCVPWRLADSIHGHDVASVIDLGWAGLTNGPPLDAMAGQFDVWSPSTRASLFSSGSTTVPLPSWCSAHSPTGFQIFFRSFRLCCRCSPK